MSDPVHSTHPRDHIPQNIRRVAKSLGYAVFLDDPDAWAMLAPILAARLSVSERMTLALVTLASLPEDALEHVAVLVWGDA